MKFWSTLSRVWTFTGAVVLALAAVGASPAAWAQGPNAEDHGRDGSAPRPAKFGLSHHVGPFRGWGVYTEELDGDEKDAAAIGELGVSYVVYFYRGGTDAAKVASALQDFKNLNKLGINVALWVTDDVSPELRRSLAAPFKSVPNLVAWYVFDEPVHKKKSVPDQDAAISAMRSVRNLPCAVAEYSNDFPTIPLSLNYDFVFSDRYHQYVNNNRAVKTNIEKLSSYGAIDPLIPMFGLNRVIPVYGAYSEKTHPMLSEDELLATFVSKRELYGPGAFFLYDARRSGGALTTLKNNESLRKVVRAVLTKDMQDARMQAAATPLPGSAQVESFDAFKAGWQKVVDRRSTAKLDYKPGRLPIHSGAYLTKGQFIVIDFDRPMQTVRLFGRFFNKGSASGVPSKIAYARSVEDANGGNFLSERTLVLPPRRELPFSDILQNVNSRQLVIIATAGEWNVLSGFDALGYTALPE